MWWLIILVGLFAWIYLKTTKLYNYWNEKNIPGVKPRWFFGNMTQFVLRKRALAHVFQDMYEAYPDKRYIGAYMFFQPILVIRDPELIKQITVKGFDAFPDHRPFTSNNKEVLLTRNVFSLTYAKGWHDMRATLSPAFTSNKLKTMFALIDQCAEQMINYFEQQKGTLTVELKDVFTRFTNDVVGTTAFGITCNSLEEPENEFYLMGQDLTNLEGIKGLKFFAFALSPALTRMFNVSFLGEKTSEFFISIIKETIRFREKNQIVRPDMIYLLTEAKKGRLKHEAHSNVVDSGFAVVHESEMGKTEGKKRAELTDDDIAAQASAFLFAGIDTASTLMCFCLYELALNPDIQERLHQEIRESLENSEGRISYEAILGMKYLDCVISESLRKWPPAAFIDRICVKPFTIDPERPGENPLHFEPGSQCQIPVYAIHRDPKYYPEPEKFDPERFSDENKHNIQPFTYLPFGSGPRSCIGSRFALIESKLIVVRILQKFEVVPVEKTQIPLEMSAKKPFPATDAGFWLGLKPRSRSS